MLGIAPELYLRETNLEVAQRKKTRNPASANADATAEGEMTAGHFEALKWELEYCKRRYGALAD